jgi:hypothetical protein
MTPHRPLFTGLCLLLVLTVNTTAESGQSWENWVENYYLSPEPDKVATAVRALSRSGYFERAGQPATAIGFFGAVFARNPGMVADWMRSFQDLPGSHRRLVAAALWYSGAPEGAAHLRELAKGSDATTRAEIEQLSASWTQPSLEDTPVLSKSSLDLQWGAFLGSGNPRHVVNVLAALGSEERAVGTAARLALAGKALAHPRVYEICQAEIARQPAGIREQLNTALLGRSP